MQVLYDHPEGNYTQVPNELLECPHLSPKEKLTWILLASVCRNGKSHEGTIRSLTDVAKKIGANPKHFTTDVNRLIRAGGAVKEYGDCKLLIPTEKAAPSAIQQEVEEQPRRKHSVSQEEVWPSIKDAWNRFKPESWMRLDGKLHTPLFIALETQAKRLNIERPDYAKFVGQVCRGGTIDPWWSKQAMKATGVFGIMKVKDTKFENVEKLYKLGAKVEIKADLSRDEDVLAKYAAAGAKKFIGVKRVQVKDLEEARDHINDLPDQEFRDYAYLYFTEGEEKPLYWSHKNKSAFMYIF